MADENSPGADRFDDDEAPVEIPYESLSDEALAGVIESFVVREGTDYGHQERSFADKRQAVLNQLQRGDARIFFDPNSQSINIVTKA